ncbi:MAG TPA: UxaA family hydrolase [Terracidiphilus sp.]|nr:UxaA family hydrolase [Terracidiphilus sp.]
MPEAALKLDPRDNVVVALAALQPGLAVNFAGSESCIAAEAIPPKQKMALVNFKPGDFIYMYGMVVGEAVEAISRGGLITTRNIRHRTGDYSAERHPSSVALPDASPWASRTFMGFHRADGQVGTRNYWIVLPLVFCENRNVEQMREALEEELGYGRANSYYRQHVRNLIRAQANGNAAAEQGNHPKSEKVFPNLDGVRFLTHQLGCGGTRQDARALCGLLAGYIHHPNVAGATILSLGCQNAQSGILMEELRARDPKLGKPVLIFEQQKSGRESALIEQALNETFSALSEANRAERAPAPLSALTVGLQCGGSDGFSGISANPVIGHLSDLLVGLAGKTMLSEFPELHGVEQELINRCVTDELAQRFSSLMQTYAARARAVQSDFAFNPSPGNIRDGLITDAIKSAGAARKGGTAPISDVIDYPEYVRSPGLTLQCTPGNDVESVTAQVGAGCSLVLFTTGLGTPTGNPIAPVLKISTNSTLASRMGDIIDFDAGGIVTGEATITSAAEQLLELSIEVASGTLHTKAEERGQVDFIPWKRGVSL